MGARAANQRAQARLANEQARQLRGQRVAAETEAVMQSGEILSPWRAPTLREFFLRRRRNKQLRTGRHS
jgi:hypothetical protein